MKTRGRLDPVRNPDGSTTWLIDGLVRVQVQQNKDLLTPLLAGALQHSWEVYEEMLAWDEARRRGRLQDADPASAPAPVDDPDPPF